MTVEFREIPNFPGYRVGDDGTVWTRRAKNRWRPGALSSVWAMMAPNTKPGYPQVGLRTAGGERVYFLVHHLVLSLFVGPRPDGMEACHNDGNPLNPRLSNLRWDTPKANKADMVRHGTERSKGVRNPNVKLTREQVDDIKRRLAAGQRPCRIAQDFPHVTASTIYMIRSGQTWGEASLAAAP